MKRFLNWQVILGILLVALSAGLYSIHYLIFKDGHHIFLYLLGDIAFLPIEVLLVTMIIHRLLEAREKQAMLKKLNMLIGAFFGEVGTVLLKSFSGFDRQPENIRKELIAINKWSEKDFRNVGEGLKKYNCKIEYKADDIEKLKAFLIDKRTFLVGLLQNPNLLEHETFTDLLWAVFHLLDELSHRADVRKLPPVDYEHIAGDIKRAYVLLICEWAAYMKHMRSDYPYLFSLAVRTNPFDPEARVEVR